ncbi:MnhB domain-containing protein [Salinarimonas chemoclinalis]|uniref:MnhB domain-containing protein n=1 Tax=Salinarimonas chemoclinalis TaxID=3241599 RepID=UPI003557B1A3
MPSLILTAVVRIFFVIMLLGSLWVLLRGHNEPGGGFIGGLVGAAGFSVLALALGVEAARRALVLHPVVLMGAGLGIAFLSGVPGIVTDASFLTHQWGELAGLKLGTTIAFDVGVYMVVVGGVLSFMFRLYAEDAA